MRRLFLVILLILYLFIFGCASGSSGSSETNHVPSVPGTISASDIMTDSALVCWDASSDPDGDPIAYEIEYGNNNTLDWISAGTTTNTCIALSGLEPDTTYVVRVRAFDDNGGISEWNEQDPAFTTNPMDIPVVEESDTYPYRYANDPLSWISTGDAVSYNIYFGESDNDVNNASDPDTLPGRGNQTGTIYYPGTLALDTWYYWRIDAADSSGTLHKGEVWEFYVPETPDPPPDGEPVGGHAGYTQIVDISESDYIVINDKEELTSVLDLLSTVEKRIIYINGDVVIDLIGDLIGVNNIEIPSVVTLYIVVDTKEELKSALTLLSITNGGIIYVRDDAEIDLTGEKLIEIPSGVTLASGRGRDYLTQGGLIYKESYLSDSPLFLIKAQNVRVTGLRLRGPGPTHTGAGGGDRGIATYAAIANLEIDNCELYNWSYCAIGCDKGSTPYIHHNYIHDCGYGVEIWDSTPNIKSTVFNRCSHAIAGTGETGCGYEASYNIVLDGAVGHSFDMHSPQENPDNPTHDDYTTYEAGDLINIHHNTVTYTENSGVLIRGKPRIGAEIYYNWFFHDTIDHATRQKYNFGNFNVHDNYLTINKTYVP